MRAQRLVHPQSVERLGVEPGEEHVDHDDQVDGPLRQPPRDVLVVALEALRARVVGGAELSVVVTDRFIEEGAVVGGQLRGVHGLIGQRLTGRIGVGRVGVNNADAQAPVRGQPLLLPLELHVVGARRPDRRRREQRVEAEHALLPQRVGGVAPRLLVEVLTDVTHHLGQPLGRQ